MTQYTYTLRPKAKSLNPKPSTLNLAFVQVLQLAEPLVPSSHSAGLCWLEGLSNLLQNSAYLSVAVSCQTVLHRKVAMKVKIILAFAGVFC